MIRIYLAILMFIILINNSLSQKVLLEETPPKDTIIEKFGPNRKHYGHVFFGYGNILGKPDYAGADIDHRKSQHSTLGYRYKLKINKFYSAGFDIACETYTFNLKQNAKKNTPDTLLHKSEKINIQDIDFSVFNRINYGRRGNTIGKFVDFGAFINWNFGFSHITKDDIDGVLYKVRATGVDYYEPIIYGFIGRIGFGKFVFYGKHRYSDLFNDKNLQELPRYTVGLQLGFSK